MMDERQQVRQLAREYAEGELRPHAHAWDEARTLGEGVVPGLAELGFFGMLAPEEHGGLDFELRTYLAALEELARAEPVAALLLSIHSAFGVTLIRRHGTDAQKAQWLHRLASGEAVACFALSEAEAGSDAAAVATRALRDGDRWLLDGEKKWVTHGRQAGLALVVARIHGEDGEPIGPPARSLGMFLVPTDTAGYESGERETTMGLRAAEVVTVRLNGVRLDGDALLGEPGRGFHLAMEGLDLGRLGIAAQALGIARAGLEYAVDYAGEREQFNTKLRDFQGMQFKLADMATRVAAAGALVEAGAASPSTQASAIAKLYASETAMWVATQAVQVYGGYGYMREYPVEKLMRDAKATEIYEGTNQVLRVVIAKGLYKA